MNIYFVFLTSISIFGFIILSFKYYFLFEHHKILTKLHSELNDLHDSLVDDFKDLEQKKSKEVLTIEADQILHDMTRYGHSIVRIMPISPTDVFWRSPS